MTNETNEQAEALHEYDEQIAECDAAIAQIKLDIAEGQGVSGADWRAAGEVMAQLLDAIETGDLKKQTRAARKLAGILDRTHTANELRESQRRWTDAKRKWTELRERAERSIAREQKRKSKPGWWEEIGRRDEEAVRIAPDF